jgi:hypothetical protein
MDRDSSARARALRVSFVVDGDRWIGDPFAVEQSNDGFGSQNAVLDVRPESVAVRQLPPGGSHVA